MSALLDYILKNEDAFRKQRLPSLYSDFALQRRTNPDGYDVNVAAWEQALIRAARKGLIRTTVSADSDSYPDGRGQRKQSDHLVLRTGDALLRELELPEWGRPVALNSVFAESLRKSSMVLLQLYKTDSGSLRKQQWRLIDPSVLNPFAVLTWGMKQLRGFVTSSDLLDASPRVMAQDLVLVENLELASTQVIEQALARSSSKIDLIYSKESFMSEFSNVLDGETDLSETDFDVLLLYLSRDVGAIAYDGKTVKFRSANETPSRITQQDTTIASIRTLIATMSKQVKGLEHKIEELTVTAKRALKDKNRISALSAVRSKKIAERNLSQRLETLNQLEEIFSKIEQAADQVEIVTLMEASTGVLRSLHGEVGGIERVEDVVEELRTEISKVDEVESIMNEVGSAIDEAEIDDELNALESAERQAMEGVEAEDTREPLSELDRILQTSREVAREALFEQDTESALSESIERLSQLTVKDDSEETSRLAARTGQLASS